jgi:DNA-binding transcriptional LysR family regulator
VTPGQLRTFATVAELESIRTAAERLNVTESAVSAAMAGLQRQLGAQLLTREGRGIRLTAAGASYAAYAERVLGLLAEGAAAALAEADPGRGRLRLAAVTSAGEILLPPLLAGFRTRHPAVHIELEVAPRRRVWELMRRHAVDLAVAGRPPADASLVTRSLRRNQLIVVAAPRLVADVANLHGVAWLLREPGSGTRDTLEALLETVGADGPRFTLGSNGAVVAGAVVGLGATLAARDVVVAELEDGRLTELAIPGTPLDRPFHLVSHVDPSATSALFIEHSLRSGEWGAPAGKA